MKSFFRQNKLLVAIIIIYIIFMTELSLEKENNLTGGDFTEHRNIISNSIDGKLFYNDITNENHFNRSAFIIGIFLLPAYYLLPHNVTLLFFQSFSFGLTALILFKLMTFWKFDYKIKIILILTYLVSANNIFVNLEEFHFIVFALPLMMLCVYAIETKNNKLFFISLILLLFVKQHLFLIGLSLGICLLIKKRFNLAKKTIIISIVYFILLFLLFPNVIQSFASERYAYLTGNEVELTNSNAQYLTNNDGLSFLKKIVRNKDYVKTIIFPNNVLPFFNVYGIIGIPIVILNSTTSNLFQGCSISHHSVLLLTILFFGSIYTLKLIYKKKVLFFIALLLLLITQILFNIQAYDLMFNESFEHASTIFHNCVRIPKTSTNELIINSGFIHTSISYLKNIFI